MRQAILMGTTAAALIAIPQTAPAVAQDDRMMDHSNMERTSDAFPMNAQQQGMYTRWPDDRRMAYEDLDRDSQEYYWSLDQDDQDAYWRLDDRQRSMLMRATPQQRMTIMNSARTAMGGGMNDARTTMSRQSSMPAGQQIRFVSNAVVQNIPPPHQGEYPACTSDQDNNCIQRGGR